MSSGQLALARRRIGVLLADLVDPYQAAVLEGAREAARSRAVDLVCFVGGELESPRLGERQRNHVFSFVSKENVDAVLVMAGAIGNRCGWDRLAGFCARFANLPTCTVGASLAGIPSVGVDNRMGIHDAVSHLVRVHGRRRIAFIKGPESSQEAADRFDAYREALAEHAIEVDPRLVAPGDFTGDSGERAIGLFFGERKLDVGAIDAILAADDPTALGAMRALDRRKIRIPSQIAVVGFDDLQEARFSAPPLTTLRQPLREQGAAAVRVLLKRLQGDTSDLSLSLATTTVVRRSCGCFAGEARVAARAGATNARLSFEAELLRRREALAAELSRVAQGALAATPGWEDLLIRSFAEQLRTTPCERFTRAFRSMLDALVAAGADLTAVQDITTVLRQHMLDSLERDGALRDRAEEMFHEARLVTSEAMERAQAQRCAQAEAMAGILSGTSRQVAAAQSLDELCAVVGERFPALGITSCHVSLFEDGDPAGSARPLFAYDPEAVPVIARGGSAFPSRRLVAGLGGPTGRSRTLVVSSVYSGTEHLGIMAISFDAAPGHVSDAIADMVGGVVDRMRRLDRARPSSRSTLVPPRT
jgi:DNA-binding LacI/PurR family transcriptional regulator